MLFKLSILLESFFYFMFKYTKWENSVYLKTAYVLICCILYLLISYFHEPWFDEAQAWMIARDASYYEMLFVLPHYEGHPPFWTLLLSIPAKLGIPFEIGLKLIGLLIYLIIVQIIIFKSPFNRYVSLSLPLTYFVFYQYGVIVRPYSLLILSLLLLAANFENRFKKPWIFLACLILLCNTGAYGMVMAAGVAICLMVDLIKVKGIKKFIGELLIDETTVSLCVLLLFALFEVVLILPVEDTHVTSTIIRNSLFVRLLCTFFTSISDAVVTRSEWFFYDRTLLQSMIIPAYSLVLCSLLGIIILLIIYSFSNKSNFKYFLIPYLFYSIFGAIVYFSGHHIGCCVGLIIFVWWINQNVVPEERNWSAKKDKLKLSCKDDKLIRNFGKGIVSLCFVVSIIWSVSTSFLDISKQYSYGRETARFVKENHLEDLLIFGGWEVRPISTAEKEDIKDMTEEIGVAPLLNAYFSKNIVDNLNVRNKNKGFMYWKTTSDAQNKQNFDEWRKLGYPEILLGLSDYSKVFDDFSVADFTTVYYMEMSYCWKGDYESGYIPVLARKDIVKKYGLSRAELPEGLIPADVYITDEIRAMYESDELTLEDIIQYSIEK